MNREVRKASQVTLGVKNLPTSAGDTRDATPRGVRKIPWRRKWQPTPVFLPGKSHGKRSLAGPVQGAAKSRTWPSIHAHKEVRGDTLEYLVICGTYWERGIVHFNLDISIFFKLFIRNVLHWSKENAFSVWVRRHGQGFNVPFFVFCTLGQAFINHLSYGYQGVVRLGGINWGPRLIYNHNYI